MKHTKLKSINELIIKIQRSIKTENELLWFRGHSDAKWVLTPTIFRHRDYSINLEISKIKLFKEHAASLIKDRFPTNTQDWLVMMRHYHFPTRILDWTENPLIALYFALVDKNDNDSALFMLKPYKLNYGKKTSNNFKNDSLPTFDEDPRKLREYLPGAARNPEVLEKIIAFSAPRFFDRLQRQLGTFTIHLDNTLLDENMGKRYLEKFIIPKKFKNNIMKELDILKINKFTVYPELSYLYEGINNE